MPGAEDLLVRWLKRVRESAFAHYAAEEQYSRLNYALGVPAAFLAAVVGTTVFASLDKVVDNRVKILVGALSIGSAVLTGLQTFLKYGERADLHRKTAVRFAGLRRDLELALLYRDDATQQSLDRLKQRYDDIVDAAPNVHNALWKRASLLADKDLFVPAAAPAVPAPTLAGGSIASPWASRDFFSVPPPRPQSFPDEGLEGSAFPDEGPL